MPKANIAHELTVLAPDVRRIAQKTEATAAFLRSRNQTSKATGKAMARNDWLSYRHLLQSVFSNVSKAGGQANLDGDSTRILNRIVVDLNRIRNNLSGSDSGPPSSGRGGGPKGPGPGVPPARPKNRAPARVGEADILREAVNALDGESDDFSWNQIKSGARKALAVAQIAGRLWGGSPAPADDAAKLRDMGTLIEDDRRRKRDQDVAPGNGRKPAGAGSREAESGWEVALRGSSRRRGAVDPARIREARGRIVAATAPAFAAALDRAVDAKLLTRFAAKHPGGIDTARLRTVYVATATRRFAAEFVTLVGGRPPAAAEDIALGAIIAVAIAQTSATYPIVPPAAIAPMAVLVNRALRPRLAELARTAAIIAAAPAAAAARPHATPAREMAW